MVVTQTDVLLTLIAEGEEDVQNLGTLVDEKAYASARLAQGGAESVVLKLSKTK